MTPGLCEGSFTLARTYIISDFSGNADSMLVTVNVVDTHSPCLGHDAGRPQRFL